MLTRFLHDFYKIGKIFHANPSDIEKMQLKRLRAIIRHAYKNVYFYRRKFDDAGIKPSNLKTFKDLIKVPITTKAEIQAIPLKDISARTLDIDKCIINRTSGSTGFPLTTIIEERTRDFERAIWTRAFWENGLRVRDKRVLIRDPRSFPKKTSWTEHFGVMRRKHLSIFDRVEKQIAFLENYRPDVIEGYPSSFEILAHAIRSNMKDIQSRLIFTYGEYLDRASRKLISSVFQADLLDYYGSAELQCMAWECNEHMGYHMNLNSLVMELIKDGEAVAPSERGEIVCTSLTNYAMPLIRYRIGDVGVPSGELCSCGIKLPLMKTIDGHKDDLLVTQNGRIIPPTIFFPYPFENFEKIRQFRIIQERKDKLTIQLVVKATFHIDEWALEKARKRIQRVFGEDVNVDFELLEKIDLDPSGKLRKIISHVPLVWSTRN